MGEGYPVLVKASLGMECPGEYEFINRGIGGNRSVDIYARIKEDFINLKPDYASIYMGVNDAWLEALGYRREGEYYRVIAEDTDRAVAMFAHQGALSVALGHMFNMPFPQVCGAFDIDFTAIMVLERSNAYGKLVYPKWIMLDESHIQGLEAERFYGN